MTVHAFFRIASLIVAAFAVSACMNSAGRPGKNYSPKNDSSIVINESHGTFRLFVDDEDKTAAYGATFSTPTGESIQLIQANILRPDDRIPGNFSIQGVQVGFVCQGKCPGNLSGWELKEI